MMPDRSSNSNRSGLERVSGVTYWRVEGSLFELSALRSVGFFNWNSQSFLERWVRRSGMLGVGLFRPPMYLASRTFATRFLHGVLRGITKDRLDLLGEEYFQYELKPRMRREAVEKLIDAVRGGERVVLVSQLLEHIMLAGRRAFLLQLFESAMRADLHIGNEEELELGIGEDRGADVASFHHDAAASARRALQLAHPRTHNADRREFRR